MPRQNKILIRNGTTTPSAGDFDTAEPAWDKTAGKLYIKDGAGSMVEIGGGGGGLTHFVESEETASPNATVPVDALTATDASYTNIDVALVPKGTGAFLAQVPNSTTTGGNKRGSNATDLQTSRTGASQVASGNYSVIAGGQNNTASSAYSFIGGGRNNEVKTNSYTAVVGGYLNDSVGQYSFVGAGYTNAASGQYSTIAGGRTNTANALYAAIGGGSSNQATAIYACVPGGSQNQATGSYSNVGGGSGNQAIGSYSCAIGGLQNYATDEASAVLGGTYGTTRATVGRCVIPASRHPIVTKRGVSQSAILVLGRETTDATPTVLASSSVSPSFTNQVSLDDNTAFYFRGSVIANVTGAGDTKAWTFEGAIKRGATAATTAVVGSVSINTIAQDTGASGWSIAVTANTTQGCLQVEVTGAAATTIRWVAKIETTEVGF